MIAEIWIWISYIHGGFNGVKYYRRISGSWGSGNAGFGMVGRSGIP